MKIKLHMSNGHTIRMDETVQTIKDIQDRLNDSPNGQIILGNGGRVSIRHIVWMEVL